MLHPAGVEAQTVANLWWIMLAGGVLVLALVLATLFYGMYRTPEKRARVSGGVFIFAGGVALPTISLTILLIYTLGQTRDLRAAVDGAAFDVQIIAHRWWWEVRYLGEEHEPRFTTANELHLPRGERVRIKLTTADVIHSFWAPSLAGKMDLIPGADNEIVLQPTQAGVYRAQCAEYCGAQHARMALDVTVHEPGDFDTWRTRQAEPAAEPVTELARRGREVFLNEACAWCHRVRGTSALGTAGPDLTHVGSRLSIAAGTLPGNRGNLAAWIVDAQHLKPGALMPSFRTFSGEELRALAAYMEELE